MKSAKGFTLIETLVVVVVLGVIGVALVNILPSSFRANDKSKVLGNVKQNGQAALNRLTTAIRGAHSIVCIESASSPSILTIQNYDGTYTRFIFDPSVGTSKNGVLLQESLTYSQLPNPASPDSRTTNDFCSTTEVPIVSVSKITDDDLVAGVSIERAFFRRLDKNLIYIYFEVEIAKNAAANGFSQKLVSDSEIFQTSVQRR